MPNVYGFNSNGVVSNFILQRSPVIYGKGNHQREFIYIDDVVEALITAAEKNVDGRYLAFPAGEVTDIRTLAGMLGREKLKQLDERPFDVERPSAVSVMTPGRSLWAGLGQMIREVEAAGMKHYSKKGGLL